MKVPEGAVANVPRVIVIVVLLVNVSVLSVSPPPSEAEVVNSPRLVTKLLSLPVIKLPLLVNPESISVASIASLKLNIMVSLVSAVPMVIPDVFAKVILEIIGSSMSQLNVKSSETLFVAPSVTVSLKTYISSVSAVISVFAEVAAEKVMLPAPDIFVH